MSKVDERLRALLSVVETRELTTEERIEMNELKAQVEDNTQRIGALEAETGEIADEVSIAEDAAVAAEDVAEEAAARSLPQVETPKPAPQSTRMVKPPVGVPSFVRDLGDRQWHANRATAFRGWVLNAAGKCTNEHRKAANAIGFDLSQRSITVNLAETRAAGDPMSTQVAGKGKEFVPVEFSTNYINKVNYVCPIRQYSNVLTTSNGHKIEVPVVNDTAKGTWIAENDAKPLSEFASANLTLSSYKVVSGVVKVSEEMLRDSAIPLAKIIADALALRIARSQEEKFLVGTGTNEPQGVVTGATAATATTAAAGSLTVNDLLALKYSVDPAYRDNGVFIVNDATLMALHAARLTSNGEPAFVTNYMDPKQPVRLFGHPVIVSNAMPSGTTTGTIAAVFGDLSSYFMIRDVQTVELRVTTELYWLNNQVGFLAEAFCDSRVLNTDAIKKLAYK